MAEDVKDIKSVSEFKPLRYDEIVAVVGRLNELNSDLAAARGALGTYVKEQEKEAGVNRKAISLIAQLSRMNREKVADFARTFGPWFDEWRTRNSGEVIPFDAAKDERHPPELVEPPSIPSAG